MIQAPKPAPAVQIKGPGINAQSNVPFAARFAESICMAPVDAKTLHEQTRTQTHERWPRGRGGWDIEES